MSVWHLARDIGVPVRRIFEIVQGQRPINGDIAHRLAHYFGMSERYWLDLQERYERKTRQQNCQGVSKKAVAALCRITKFQCCTRPSAEEIGAGRVKLKSEL